MVCLAQIGAPHGVRGEVRLRSFTEVASAFASYGPFQSGGRLSALEVAAARPIAEGLLVVRFKGIDDRSTAERLRGLRLFVPRARLPGLEEDVYYHADLIGLTAVAPDETVIGTVCAVHNFGAGDLLEIAPTAGGPSRMVPFTKQVVPTVDVSGGRLKVVEAGSRAEMGG